VDPEIVSLRKTLGIYKGLVEVSGLIASITDYGELLRAILRVARNVIGAEAASLFLVDEHTRDLVLTISSHAEGQFHEPALSVPKGQGIAGWVMEHREALLVPDAYADSRFYRKADEETGFRTRSILCAPLQREGTTIGVLQVLNPLAKPAFEPEDLEGFSAYANLTASAIEKLRALDRLRRQERVERDLAIASEIQSELLAGAIPPCAAGMCFAAHNRPAANVGGDFYDVFPRAAGDVFFAVGDVSGKGISASLLMAQVLSAMEFVFRSASGPAEPLRALNQHLGHRIVRGMFVTAVVGRIRADRQAMLVASAGHPAPLLIVNGQATAIEAPGAMPLGILPDTCYLESEVAFPREASVVAFTDGLTESADPQARFFEPSIARVAEAAAAGGPSSIVEALVEAELTHRGAAAQRDDLTILAGGFA
jgi:sigma-B regulation protein RsbU (phosphoserine phosphatase)